MPPRRPGGKYKGVVGRRKGEETLMKEAEERRRAALEAHIARLEAKRETDLKAAEELRKQQQEQDEETKQKILNFLLGGRKGNSKKFFKAWIIGAQIYKKEKKVLERDHAWRKSCSCLDPACPGGCNSYQRLSEYGFQLPFDAARKSGVTFFASTGELLWPQPPPLKLPFLLGGTGEPLKPPGSIAAPGRTAVDPFGARSVRPRAEAALQPPGGPGARSASLSALLPGPGRSAAGGRRGGEESPSSPASPCRGLCQQGMWPCRCSSCRPTLPPHIDRETAEVMVHHKSGRRCLVEPQTMRMCFADVVRPHCLNAAQTVM